MLNLDTHILLHALAAELTAREAALLVEEPWSIAGRAGPDRVESRRCGIDPNARARPCLAAHAGSLPGHSRAGLSFLGYAYALSGRIAEGIPLLEHALSAPGDHGTGKSPAALPRVSGRGGRPRRPDRGRSRSRRASPDPCPRARSTRRRGVGPPAPRRPLPPRRRQALPARRHAGADPRSPHHRVDDVPRDGHALLAHAGGGDHGCTSVRTCRGVITRSGAGRADPSSVRSPPRHRSRSGWHGRRSPPRGVADPSKTTPEASAARRRPTPAL